MKFRPHCFNYHSDAIAATTKSSSRSKNQKSTIWIMPRIENQDDEEADSDQRCSASEELADAIPFHQDSGSDEDDEEDDRLLRVRELTEHDNFMELAADSIQVEQSTRFEQDVEPKDVVMEVDDSNNVEMAPYALTTNVSAPQDTVIDLDDDKLTCNVTTATASTLHINDNHNNNVAIVVHGSSTSVCSIATAPNSAVVVPASWCWKLRSFWPQLYPEVTGHVTTRMKTITGTTTTATSVLAPPPIQEAILFQQFFLRNASHHIHVRNIDLPLPTMPSDSKSLFDSSGTEMLPLILVKESTAATSVTLTNSASANTTTLQRRNQAAAHSLELTRCTAGTASINTADRDVDSEIRQAFCLGVLVGMLGASGQHQHKQKQIQQLQPKQQQNKEPVKQHYDERQSETQVKLDHKGFGFQESFDSPPLYIAPDLDPLSNFPLEHGPILNLASTDPPQAELSSSYVAPDPADSAIQFDYSTPDANEQGQLLAKSRHFSSIRKETAPQRAPPYAADVITLVKNQREQISAPILDPSLPDQGREEKHRDLESQKQKKSRLHYPDIIMDNQIEALGAENDHVRSFGDIADNPRRRTDRPPPRRHAFNSLSALKRRPSGRTNMAFVDTGVVQNKAPPQRNRIDPSSNETTQKSIKESTDDQKKAAPSKSGLRFPAWFLEGNQENPSLLQSIPTKSASLPITPTKVAPAPTRISSPPRVVRQSQPSPTRQTAPSSDIVAGLMAAPSEHRHRERDRSEKKEKKKRKKSTKEESRKKRRRAVATVDAHVATGVDADRKYEDKYSSLTSPSVPFIESKGPNATTLRPGNAENKEEVEKGKTLTSAGHPVTQSKLPNTNLQPDINLQKFKVDCGLQPKIIGHASMPNGSVEPFTASTTTPNICKHRSKSTSFPLATEEIPKRRFEELLSTNLASNNNCRSFACNEVGVPVHQGVASSGLNSLTPFKLLCSEMFLETCSEAVAELASGLWTSSLQPSDGQSIVFPPIQSNYLGRRIEFYDSSLVDKCGIDIELCCRRAIVVVDLSSWIGTNQGKLFTRRSVQLAAIGRFKQLDIILCSGIAINKSVALQVTQLQNALLRYGNNPPTTCVTRIVSPSSLSATIAHCAFSSIGSKYDAISCLYDAVRAEPVSERIRFLLSLVPTLTVGGAIQLLLRNSRGRTLESLIGESGPAFHRLLTNASFGSEPKFFGDAHEIHPSAIQQLSFVLNAFVGQIM